MFTKKGEATLTVLILGVLAVSLISFVSSVSPSNPTGMDTLSINTNSNQKLRNISLAIETDNNKLELRESFGNVMPVVEDFMWDPLKEGTISTSFGVTTYRQYMRFKSDSLDINNTPFVDFTENNEAIETVSDFLSIKEGGIRPEDAFFEYELKFENGLKSSISASKLTDLNDESLNILGQTYIFIDTLINTSANEVKFVLLGGDVRDILEEGEKRLYTIKGKTYDVQVVLITDQNPGTVVFRVNGEQTSELNDGEVEILSDGTLLGVSGIVSNEAGEAGGGDIVEFYIGANKLELEDKEYVDSNFESGVKINNELIEEAWVSINAEKISEGQLNIKNIKYRLIADSLPGLTSVYVPPGHGIREFLDEPTGMIGQNWDILYQGLKDNKFSTIKFISVNNGTAYELEVHNKDNSLVEKFTIPSQDLPHEINIEGGLLQISKLNDNETNVYLITPSIKFNKNSPLDDLDQEVLNFKIKKDSLGRLRIKRDTFLLNNKDFILLEPDDNKDHQLGMTDYGVKVDLYEPSGTTEEAEEVLISYPFEQVTAIAYLNFVAPLPDNCEDTDGGKNFSKKGKVKYFKDEIESTFIDNCRYRATDPNSKVLDEGYCDDNRFRIESFECIFECSNGACISAPAPTCTMSVNPTTIPPKGNTTLRWNSTGATEFFIDLGHGWGYTRTLLSGTSLRSILNQTTTYLGEARGLGGTSTCQTTIKVMNPTCTDTDPNNDVYIKGEVKASGVGYGYHLADVCSGSKKVKERYCGANKKPKDLIKTCPNNKKCIQAKGICQK